PWFSDWGRDALISLPGLALIQGRVGDACKVLEHFLNNMHQGRVATRIENGSPQYYDTDSTLWLIDRIKKYVDTVGEEEGAGFLHTYWWTLKDAVDSYAKMVEGGVLVHDGGTWMDTLKRHSAVEIQGLWYNALNHMQGFSELMGDEADYGALMREHEENFPEKYMENGYLKDTLEDGALRPSQLINLSLDFCVVESGYAKKIIQKIDERLITPYGVRTLDPSDPRYCPRYVGSPEDRDKAYHNGTVWPWLLGSYITSVKKYLGQKEAKKRFQHFNPLFEKHLWQAGLAHISEVFDAEPPHKPRGCIAQAWSEAELIRSYFDLNKP
ncbi:MAG: hypothetical protein GF334_07335, partial [Candidatus Altiarchaeales archaeon]|nr:hypothetical protein [Candidatus Altiarchaeales archaeon]